MKKIWHIVLCLQLAIQVAAQNGSVQAVAQDGSMQTAAGRDFYFTLLDHWGWSGNSAAQPIKYVGISIYAIEDADITFSTPINSNGAPIYTWHIDAGWISQSSFAYPDQLVSQGVSIHSTGNLYINIWVHGGTSSDESVILPKHLLGKSYMLQGISRTMVIWEETQTPTYSQFTVVGTEDVTSVSVSPRVNMVCRSRSDTLINAGQVYTTSIQENEVLLFQPENYSHDISGTVVESDKAVAVFQGNIVTVFHEGIVTDYVWEQARPTDAWGKEFIVAGTGRLVEKAFAITALEDNTQVEFYIYSMRYNTVTLNRGETAWGGENISGSGFATEYIKASKPVCCYLYTPSHTINGKGDPSMAEILPVDHMATEAHWGLIQTDDNGPYSNTLLVTTRDDNTDNVKFNGRLLSEYSSQSGVETYSIYGYTTYEIPHTVSGNLTTSGSGFSAYVVRVASRGYDASAFNVTLPDPPPEELCMDGKLLFREDFGGNEESDPVAGTDPVDGMSSSYEQIYDTAHCHGRSGCRGMGSGRYLLTKTGYRNAESYTWSHWYIMDDHTYPNDYNRGYLLEIDGKGGSDAFFKKRMDGLCSGSKLSFTAYVANVTTGASYLQNRHSYTYPRLSFIITDPRDGTILARHNTDTIGHDWQFYNQPGAWRNSAEWQLVGMNFTVPEGVDEVELSIINNSNGWTGNDFALDDIEIRLCAPDVEIAAPDSVCINTKVSLRAEMENDGTFKEPLQYKWYFSADSLNWEPVNDGNGQELRLKAKQKHTGWYRVSVAGSGGIDSENCRSMSEPFKLHVIEECPPILCPEGVLLQHEEVGGKVTNWSGEIADICANMDLSFIVNMPSPHAPTRLMIRITDSGSGNELRAYDTGDIPSDSLQVGTTFTVPEGVQGVQWSISQNGGMGGFSIENTEVRLCMEPIRITSNSPACRKKRHIFRGVYENYGTLASPEFRWEFSTDSATWTIVQEGATQNYTIPIVHKSHEGWYRVSVAEAGNLDKPNCRETSEPFKLETKYCETAVEQHFDTVVCDTLLASGYAWRGHIWNTSGNEVDTLKDIDGDDSVYVHKTLETKVCCPDILNFRVDTAVCDTLMPFVWLWRDRMLVFEEIGEQEVEIAHAKWESCVGEVYTLHLDTFHCERLYPIIVNKYNWVVLLDNRALRRFFPKQTAVSFQWYKDSVAIEGGTEDDYSETQELHGHFQLRVRMNDGLYVWSNILDISDTPESQPIHVRVYNSNGILLYEEDIQGDGYTPILPAGIYFIRYERGDEVWTEKRVTQ